MNEASKDNRAILIAIYDARYDCFLEGADCLRPMEEWLACMPGSLAMGLFQQNE
jgi:hypothetical protein